MIFRVNKLFISNLSASTFKVKVVDALPTDSDMGTVYTLSDGSTHLFNGKWEPVGSVDSITDSDSKTWSNTQKILPTNCKNCGAVLHGYICEYCGTTYN